MLGRRALLLVISLSFLASLRATSAAADEEWILVPPGAPLALMAGEEEAGTSIPPPWEAVRAETGTTVAAATAGANITVTYTGFTPQAKAAFQKAVDVWKTQITSPVEIKVDARLKLLPTGVLGMASPGNFMINTQTGNLVPVALANRLAGKDLDPKGADVIAEFNSTMLFKFYMGTDGKAPSGKYDLTTVVLHEIGHGLGFTNSARWVLGNGLYGGGGPFPLPFDTFLADSAGNTLIDLYPNASLGLGTALTSNAVYWNGLGGIAANGGKMPRMYAPKLFEAGSSLGHLDEATYAKGSPNSLMTPVLDFAESIHDPGPVTRGIFEDLGWGESTPPAIFGGRVTGGPAPGQPVVAMVKIGTRTTVCGQGEVATSGSDVVYAVEVAGTEVEGCGRKSALVSFYFPATHQVSTKQADWPSAGGLAPFNVETGPQLTNNRSMPGVSAGN